MVLDAVISVLAVTVLRERALPRRTITIKGWLVTVRWPTWPLAALWCYFGGSVAGNVAHAPQILAAQLVAAVPPISAALTFHLLLRLLDRAPTLKAIAEFYEERSVEERERAARRRARRAQLKARTTVRSTHAQTPAPDRTTKVSSDGDNRRHVLDGRASTDGYGATSTAVGGIPKQNSGTSTSELEDLRRRMEAAMASGDRVTGEIVGRWLGVSARTGRRRLATLLNSDPALPR